MIVALAIGLALGDPGLRGQAVPDPVGSMEPTLDVGQRVLVNRVSYHFSDPRSATSSSSTRPPAPRTGRSAASSRRRRGPCPKPTAERSDTNFIKRIVAGPGDTLSDRGRAPRRQRGRRRTTFIRPCRGGERVQFPAGDHHSARPLLHDGRQPWVERRQPLLGPRPPRLDHRQGLLHLLAARPNRDPLTAPVGPGAAGAAGRRSRRLFRFDRELGARFVAGADEAGRGSLAGPAGGRGGADRLRR